MVGGIVDLAAVGSFHHSGPQVLAGSTFTHRTISTSLSSQYCLGRLLSPPPSLSGHKNIHVHISSKYLQLLVTTHATVLPWRQEEALTTPETQILTVSPQTVQEEDPNNPWTPESDSVPSKCRKRILTIPEPKNPTVSPQTPRRGS